VVVNRSIRLIGRRDISPYLNIELSRPFICRYIVCDLPVLLNECVLIWYDGMT